MTTRTATRAVLRIWAVIMVGRTLVAAPALLTYLVQSPGSTVDANVLFSARLAAFSSLAIQLVVALVIFGAATRIASWITHDDTEEVWIAYDAQTLMSVGLAIFGVTVCVDGIVELGSTVYAWINVPADSSASVSFVAERRSVALARGTLEVLMGAALFFGRNAMIRVWRKARTQDA